MKNLIIFISIIFTIVLLSSCDTTVESEETTLTIEEQAYADSFVAAGLAEVSKIELLTGSEDEQYFIDNYGGVRGQQIYINRRIIKSMSIEDVAKLIGKHTSKKSYTVYTAKRGHITQTEYSFREEGFADKTLYFRDGLVFQVNGRRPGLIPQK